MHYLPFYIHAQAWYALGFELQLLETGFLVIWLAPLLSDPRAWFPSGAPTPKPVLFLLLLLEVFSHA